MYIYIYVCICVYMYIYTFVRVLQLSYFVIHIYTFTFTFTAPATHNVTRVYCAPALLADLCVVRVLRSVSILILTRLSVRNETGSNAGKLVFGVELFFLIAGKLSYCVAKALLRCKVQNHLPIFICVGFGL